MVLAYIYKNNVKSNFFILLLKLSEIYNRKSIIFQKWKKYLVCCNIIVYFFTFKTNLNKEYQSEYDNLINTTEYNIYMPKTHLNFAISIGILSSKNLFKCWSKNNWNQKYL